MTTTDPCRFCRLFAISVGAFAVLLGSLSTLSGAEYATLVLVDSVVRSLAPAAVGSALLLALVLWAQPLAATELRLELGRVLRRALMVVLPGYVAGLLVAVFVGFLVAAVFGHVPLLRKSFAMLGVKDIAMGLANTACDAGLIVFLAHRYLARLQAGRTSLPAKLVIVLTVSVPLRVSAALVLSLILPG